jgi:peptidoglycan/LPS O-acetylase OafA/YrhL
VQVFFVLSGYLITSHLLSEERINLRSFYIRRAFRILPAAFSYLLMLLLVTWLSGQDVRGGIWASLLFFRNYLGETPHNTCTLHFWSLSLEEQFYLFWPSLLALLGRVRASVFAGVLVVGIAAFRVANWSAYDVGLRFLRTEVRADALLIGCLLALALNHASVRMRAAKWLPWAFWLGFPVFVFDAYRFHGLIPLHESLAIAVMIGATSLRPQMLVSRLLELDFLKTTGTLSYSLYIWQGLFLRPYWGLFWPILLVGSFMLSYVLIEQPARRLGRRLAARQAVLTAA